MDISINNTHKSNKCAFNVICLAKLFGEKFDEPARVRAKKRNNELLASWTNQYEVGDWEEKAQLEGGLLCLSADNAMFSSDQLASCTISWFRLV